MPVFFDYKHHFSDYLVVAYITLAFTSNTAISDKTIIPMGRNSEFYEPSRPFTKFNQIR